MGISYSKSYPPKEIKDNRSKFEKKKENIWNMIQVYRSMLSGGSPNVIPEQVAAWENYFLKSYGMSVDEYTYRRKLEYLVEKWSALFAEEDGYDTRRA